MCAFAGLTMYGLERERLRREGYLHYARKRLIEVIEAVILIIMVLMSFFNLI